MGNENDTVWSHPLKVQTTVPKKQKLATATTDDSLPFELIIKILKRLPVKFLLTLKCVCTPWNSLVSSDLKFAGKHIIMSRMNLKLIFNSRIHSPNFSHKVFPLCSNGNGTIIKGIYVLSYHYCTPYSDLFSDIDRVLHISEDDQVLLEITPELVVYDPINRTMKIQDIENYNDLRHPKIYVESLISPLP